MKTKITVFICLILVILGLSANFNSQKSFDHAEASYESLDFRLKDIQIDESFSNISLSLELDEENSTVNGILEINYYNNDPLSFDRIPFHLYPSGMSYENRSGNIEILNVTTAGLTMTYEVLTEQQLMWVDLLSPIAFNENLSITIEFITTMPDGLDRMNVHGDDVNQTLIYKFAGGYPNPCVYDEWDGWNIDPYIHVGDPFYFDMANYKISINVPNEMIVAATGELKEKIVGENTTTYHYEPILPVREITFSSSRYFIVESTLIKGINISSFYLPKSADYWQDFALDITADSLQFYSESFGIYPYTTMNVVEEFTWAGGMEYPCQVYISEVFDYREDPFFYIELVIAHEVAHQWWYQLVGNDEVDEGFLDEGLTCWSTDFYKDYRHPDWYLFDPYWPIDEVRNYNYTVGLPNRINQSCADYPENESNFGFVGYRKAPMVLEKLRLTIGHENFIAGLQLYYQRYNFDFGTLITLQEAFEDIVDYDLDWFFLPWFNNEYLPKYEFETVDYDIEQNDMTITINDRNEDIHSYSYSQQILLKITNTNRDELFYSNQFWINGTTTINFELDVGGEPWVAILDYSSDVLVQLNPDDSDGILLVYETSSSSNLDTNKNQISAFSPIIMVLAITFAGIIKKESR